MVNSKLCTSHHTTSHPIHFHFPRASSLQSPPHPRHAMTFYTTSSSPSHQSIGQDLLTKKIITAHSKPYSNLSKLQTFGRFTGPLLTPITSLLSPKPLLTEHASMPHLACVSRHHKQRGVTRLRTNYVPLILLGNENAKTSPPYTTPPTLQMSAQTPLLNGS